MRHTLKLSLTSTLIINVLLLTAAQATKLNAPPLPHERELHDFSKSQEVIIPSSGSLLRRRPGFREEEQEKKQQAEEVEKKAEQERVRAQENLRNIQQQQLAIAIDANNKAVALGKEGRWAEAIQHHETAVQYDPTNRQFHINLSAACTSYGQQRLAHRDPQGAQAMFRKALAQAQDNGLAGRLLMEALRKTGVDPTSADIRLMLGDQLVAANDLEGAYIEYQAAMQLENSARTLVKMGDMVYRYGQIPQATNFYRQAIVKDPDYGPARRQLGFLAMTQQDYTTACACLRKAVVLDSKDTAAGQALIDIWRRQAAINPNSAECHLGLASALQLTGDLIGAESEYNKAATLDANHPELAAGRASLARMYRHVKAEKNKLAAITLFNQGLRREALKEIKEAVSLEPRNANYQFLLGECLESAGDYPAAHQAYLTCVLIDPEHNKEAAARMKKMQLNGSESSKKQTGEDGGKPLALPAPDLVQQAIPNAYAEPVNTAPSSKSYGDSAPHMVPTGSLPKVSLPNVSMKESRKEMVSKAVDSFANATLAEKGRDYAKAISILRELSASNLENAEVHHRLAVNLLASGQITEALAEFRLASALSPEKKEYMDDLSTALSIHKKSLMSDAGPAAAQTVVGAGR